MNKAGERTPYYVLNARVRHREHIDIIHRIDRHSSVTYATTQYSVGLLGEQWRDTKRGILNRQSRAERQNTFDWLYILPVRVTISQYKSYSANGSHILPVEVIFCQ